MPGIYSRVERSLSAHQKDRANSTAYYYDHQEEIEDYIKEDETWDVEYEHDKAEFLSKRRSSTAG